MRNGKESNETQDRESSGIVSKLKTSLKASVLMERFRNAALKIVNLGDALIASKAGKFLPHAVLAASLATTAQLWKNEKEALEKDFSLQVAAHAVEIENAISSELKRYEQLLVGVRGIFEASDYVSPEDFSQYVSSLMLSESHPEILGVSLSYYVPQEEVEDHLKFQKYRNLPDYGSRFSTGVSEHAPVVMISPATESNSRVVGFDNFSNLERKSTMERARDFNMPQITQALPLAQNSSGKLERGVIMYLPIYGKKLPRQQLEERRRNVVGWVALSFFIKDFMDDAIEKRGQNLGIEVFEGASNDASAMIYDSSEEALHENLKFGISDERVLKVLNREWTVVPYPRPQMEDLVHSERPPFILAFGTLTSFALALFFWMSIHGRGSMVAALEALKISSSNLLESEKRYRALFKDSKVPMLLVDPLGGNILDANDEAVKYYGHDADVLRSMNITQINEAEYETVQERLALIRHGLLDRFETSHRTATGAVRLVEVSASPINLGGTDGILQIISDITERKTAIERIVQMATHDELT